jgi:hypothetical protein
VSAARLLLALMLAGCLPGPRATACRPRSALPCLTAVECAVDRRTGCEVCRCSDAPFVPLGSGDLRSR